MVFGVHIYCLKERVLQAITNVFTGFIGLNLRTKRPRKNRAGSHRLERVEVNTANIGWSGPPLRHGLCARFFVQRGTI
jgi:hypothetical protein